MDSVGSRSASEYFFGGLAYGIRSKTIHAPADYPTDNWYNLPQIYDAFFTKFSYQSHPNFFVYLYNTEPGIFFIILIAIFFPTCTPALFKISTALDPHKQA